MIVLMVAALAVPVFAENGISPEEQAVLDKFAAGREIEGVLVTPMDQHINEAENFLVRNDLNADEIQLISECIDRCYDILEEEKVTDYRQMKYSPRLDEVVDTVNELAAHFKGVVTLDRINGNVVIKQTGGIDITTVIIVASVVALAAAAAVVLVVVNRKNLFAKAN